MNVDFLKRNVGLLSSVGLVATAAVWGFAFVVVKDSLDYIGPFWMVAFRFAIAAFVISALFFKKFSLLSKRYVFHGIILGFFLFSGYAVQTLGCKYTTAGKNAFITTIYVILIPLLSWPLYKKKPAFYVFLAALLSISGIGLLSLNPGEASSMNAGDVLTLICGFFYAFHILATERFNMDEDPVFLTVLQFIVASILGFATAPFFDGPVPLNEFCQKKVLLSVAYLGIFSTMIAFFLQNVCLKYVPSALASLFLSLESVFGVLFSTVLLGERLSVRMSVGCVMIFGAILMAEVLPKILPDK